MEFTVAFIDPSLDPFDHQNLDGLRVMEAIRSAGDGTGIIVITGRSRTTVPIVRDAIKQYGVLDVIGKSEVAPSDIWQLLDQGQRAYINAAGSTMLANVQDMMRGEALGSEWDQQMMDIMKFSETVNDFYEFLNRLFREFLPVIPGRALRITREFQTHSAYREDPDLAYGEYWSRSIGEAIAVCLGTRRTIESVSRYANSTSYLLGERKVRKVLKEGWTLGTVKGVVLALGGLKRGDFGGDGRG
jgi:hypothetical protein